MIPKADKPSNPIVNVFGAIGYSLLVVVYVVMVGVGVLWLVHNGSLEVIGVPAESVQSPVTDGAIREEPDVSLFSTILAYIITAFMAVTVLFVMVTLPYWLGKSGSRVLKRIIRFCQWPVTPSSLLGAKIIACGVAMVPVAIYTIHDMSTLAILWAVIAVIGVSLITFLLQHYLAKMNELEAKEIW